MLIDILIDFFLLFLPLLVFKHLKLFLLEDLQVLEMLGLMLPYLSLFLSRNSLVLRPFVNFFRILSLRLERGKFVFWLELFLNQVHHVFVFLAHLVRLVLLLLVNVGKHIFIHEVESAVGKLGIPGLILSLGILILLDDFGKIPLLLHLELNGLSVFILEPLDHRQPITRILLHLLPLVRQLFAVLFPKHLSILVGATLQKLLFLLHFVVMLVIYVR